MMAKEYKNRGAGRWIPAQFRSATDGRLNDTGGEYNTDPKEKDESQQNLSNWTEEEWYILRPGTTSMHPAYFHCRQTKEGSGHAKKEDGTEKRYLPKKAWAQMTEEEKEATDEKKQKESKKGKQFVANTPKVRAALHQINQVWVADAL